MLSCHARLSAPQQMVPRRCFSGRDGRRMVGADVYDNRMSWGHALKRSGTDGSTLLARQQTGQVTVAAQ